MTAILVYYFMYGIGGIILFLTMFAIIDKLAEFLINWIRKISQ